MIRTLLFIPVRTVSGRLAGAVAERSFERAWRAIDRGKPPDPAQEDVGWSRLVLALALQGAIARGVRGSVDHASRVAVRKLTGRWPGEEGRTAAAPPVTR